MGGLIFNLNYVSVFVDRIEAREDTLNDTEINLSLEFDKSFKGIWTFLQKNCNYFDKHLWF